MGIIDMPAYTDYWSKFLRFDKIADVMSLKRYEQIRRYLHFADNEMDDGDRYYKIRPFLERVRLNCLKVEEENHFSIDEMMVPYKGTRAGSRKQFVKNKPRRWGYKVFVRAGMTGLVYDFLIYGGEDTFRYHAFTEEEDCMGLGAKVVIALSQSIQLPACKVLYFDNFFTSLELIHHMRNEYGIFSLGTIRSNRLREANKKLPTDKNLKKKGRGAHAQVVSNESNIAIVKWFDNKCVTAASSYVDAHPSHNVLRYNKATKTRQQGANKNSRREKEILDSRLSN
ncbi:piggyBac transposable element-derived protein 3-like [Cydia splendana]|uniref:piggyBac transposable element-derived protein 3-like n=1 Tax=Cydia splendana TaxID=1100963 RepID=UPI00300D64B6